MTTIFLYAVICIAAFVGLSELHHHWRQQQMQRRGPLQRDASS